MNSLHLYRLKHELGGMVYDSGRRWVGPGTAIADRARRLCDVQVAPGPERMGWSNVLEATHG